MSWTAAENSHDEVMLHTVMITARLRSVLQTKMVQAKHYLVLPQQVISNE